MSSPSSICEIIQDHVQDPVKEPVQDPKKENTFELCDILRNTITDLTQTIKNMESEVIFLRKENIRLETEYLKAFEMTTQLNLKNRQQQQERGFGSYGVTDW